MSRESAQIKSVDEGAPFQPLQVFVRLVLHLAVEDLNPVEAHFGSQIDARFDIAQFLVLELPKRISGDCNSVATTSRVRVVGNHRVLVGKNRWTDDSGRADYRKEFSTTGCHGSSFR